MAIEIKKKEGESVGSFLYRFNKKVQQSGLIKEVRKRQSRHRSVNKMKRRSGALYRIQKKDELGRLRKYGYK